MEKQKIGLFGGSFNPIHHGHLIIAQRALEEYKLDYICFIPCFNPPKDYKDSKNFADSKHRLNMLYHATNQVRKFYFSDMEINRKGITYTIDTVECFKDWNPESELYFICGDDAYKTLNTWKEYKQIRKLIKKFIVFKRKGGLEISSTLIRKRVKEGLSIQYLVPEDVRAYIRQNKLYRR